MNAILSVYELQRLSTVIPAPKQFKSIFTAAFSLYLLNFFQIISSQMEQVILIIERTYALHM